MDSPRRDQRNMEAAYPDSSNMLSCLSTVCDLETENILRRLSQDKPDPASHCFNCDNVDKAPSRCNDCDEVLCNNCIRAHIRVNITKDHCVLPIEEPHVSPPSSIYSSSSNASSLSSPNSCNIGKNNAICDIHKDSVMYCDNCSLVYCHECNSADHINHKCIYGSEALDCARVSTLKLLAEAKLNARTARECLFISRRMLQTVNSRCNSIDFEIKNMIEHIQKKVEEREVELHNEVKKIRFYKSTGIQHQIDVYTHLLSYFTQSIKTITDSLESGKPIELFNSCDNIATELKRLRSIAASMPQVDDYVSFIPPDCSTIMAISSIGSIATGFTPGAIGEEMLRNIGKKSLVSNRNTSFLDDLTNIFKIMPSLTTPEKPCNEVSKFSLWTSGNQRHKESPNSLIKPSKLRSSIIGSTWRDYKLIKNPLLILGGEGEEDGQLCRPWGVCCTAEGNIIVADRSNNRIQIFKPDGSFLHKFGSHGTEPGLFDRPAGVAVDPLGRIIVADKDNHRIQVFTKEGNFIFTFGEKGSKISQFNYPWDVAVNGQGIIVVSDTRNHRIQLFDLDGSFVAKYGFENCSNMIKHFDSPRGVCFGANGTIIVTDFNNHRVVVIEPNFKSAKFLGTEGCCEKQFLRPQGVAVDTAGNIVVADSRNNRIQIFASTGGYLGEFGSIGKEPGQMDRPSGICVSPDGRIVVVDFGNNRVQVF